MKRTWLLVAGLLAACQQPGGSMTLAVCLDGDEIAALREHCLGPAQPVDGVEWRYDPEACRAVRVDLACDDPDGGAMGVLALEARP